MKINFNKEKQRRIVVINKFNTQIDEIFNNEELDFDEKRNLILKIQNKKKFIENKWNQLDKEFEERRQSKTKTTTTSSTSKTYNEERVERKQVVSTSKRVDNRPDDLAIKEKTELIQNTPFVLPTIKEKEVIPEEDWDSEIRERKINPNEDWDAAESTVKILVEEKRTISPQSSNSGTTVAGVENSNVDNKKGNINTQINLQEPKLELIINLEETEEISQEDGDDESNTEENSPQKTEKEDESTGVNLSNNVNNKINHETRENMNELNLESNPNSRNQNQNKKSNNRRNRNRYRT